ncbi:tetratricopeptide repeat protein [Geopsychrobacter electrodiphilus]|uniref:tetratricopeptide repeat protein n=1 Tax=Geopsychrobacter electrodiphilus TaxID=225196 RepID=UPI00035DBE1E|nr:tetratricopeptide repeat protein [Geopsychrobacter electrodiphilus]
MILIALFMFVFVLFALFFLYFWGINPGDMTVFIAADHSYTFPTPIFLIAAVLVGLLLGNGLHVFSLFGRSVSSWRGSRRLKKNEETLNIYRKGVGRLLSGDLKKAQVFLQKALERDRKRVDVHMALANVAEQEGNNPKAIDLLLKARDLEPQSLEVLFKLASVYRAAGRTEDAMETYRSLLTTDGENRKALRALRDLLIEVQDWDEALALQKRVIKAASAGSKAAAEKVLMLQLRYEVALRDLTKGSIDQAISTLEELTREKAVSTPARVSLGDAQLKKGHIDKAAEVYQAGYLTEKRSVFLARLEHCYMQAEDPSALLSFYRKQLLINSDDLLMRLYFGRFCLRIEMVDEAIDQLHAVESSGVDFPQLHLLLAEANRRRKQIDEAIKEYRLALKVDNHLSLGYVCESCGAESSQWLSRCQTCGTFDTLGLQERQELQKARPQLQKAIPHGQREA